MTNNSIEKFDIKKLHLNSASMVTGSRASGVSTLLLTLMLHMRHRVHTVHYFSAHGCRNYERANLKDAAIHARIFMHPGLESLDNIVAEQEKLARISGQQTLFVFEDYLDVSRNTNNAYNALNKISLRTLFTFREKLCSTIVFNAHRPFNSSLNWDVSHFFLLDWPDWQCERIIETVYATSLTEFKSVNEFKHALRVLENNFTIIPYCSMVFAAKQPMQWLVGNSESKTNFKHIILWILLCNTIATLLECQIAPYAVLDIAELKLASLTKASFELESETHHFHKASLLRSVQSAMAIAGKR
jgi:hypothetical protein